MIELKDRILLDNGISVISDEEAARRILKGEDLPDHIRVLRTFDSEAYELLFQESIHIDETEIDEFSITKDELDDSAVSDLLECILSSDRYEDENYERLEKEFDFFEKSGNLPFLKSMVTLINRFRSDGVVWGVGRGSSCASYLLYLLYVHDINPIVYDIPFSEFSKED